MKYWKISDYYSAAAYNRMQLQRVFFSLALISLGLDFYYHIFISQIGPNPILYQEIDPVYFLFMYLGIPQLVTGKAAVIFDTALVLSCIACIIWPGKKRFPLLFFILHFIYFIIYNMLAGHHYISIGLLVMSFPFIFYNRERFTAVFLLCRFIFCFMMFSAACWKIARGNLWHTGQVNMLLISTYTTELFTGKPAWVADTVKWLIGHRGVSHAIWCILIALETVFVAGFISFRWDKLLLISYLLFFAGGWIIFNIYNYDNLLFLLTLTPVLDSINRKTKGHKRGPEWHGSGPG